MKKPRVDVPLFFDLALAVVCLVLVWMHWCQTTRINELWSELDAQRRWLHEVDDGTRVETDGMRTEVRVR